MRTSLNDTCHCIDPSWPKIQKTDLTAIFSRKLNIMEGVGCGRLHVIIWKVAKKGDGRVH